MARGHQKAQSQAKTLEKTAKAKKQQGHSAKEQKEAAQKALVISCTICKVSICALFRRFLSYFLLKLQFTNLQISHSSIVSNA